MAQFRTVLDYGNFRNSVLTSRRFVHEDRVREFLQRVRDTARSRSHQIPVNSSLWRAQLGSDTTTDPTVRMGFHSACPYSAERMVPKAEYAGDGRVNPKRIPCLYTST